MKFQPYIIAFFFCVLNHQAQVTPEIYSWILNTNGATGYAGIPSNVQTVQYSANNVYVSASCIPGYDIGPWAGNPNIPANQNFVFKITRTPVKNTGAFIATGLGHIGVFTNGVSIFNPKDAMSYNNQNVWFRNAVVVEGPSFDDCLGHPAPNGEYHHHLNPTCLYADSFATAHSPIIGYAFDGFPVYGAYAYANTNGTGGIKRMQSSYDKRNITKRTTLPDGSTATSAGPDVSAQYPLGYFVEDFVYNAGSGDLDEHNGRFCVTPEYPAGQYCYFATLDIDQVAEYPYLIGPTYYGTIQAGNTGPQSGHNTISEPVTVYTGLTERENKVDLAIFPNPAHSTLTLHVENDMASGMQLLITDQLGQTVFYFKEIYPITRYTVDISTLAKGIYFAKLTSGKTPVIKKIIIE